ncbi:MAG: hypothetical protein QHH06_03350 [Clostridiales bacterium]|jgi:RNase P subunit RPR2|nr:hypothetical protein [Eubacteriales bacterium]MDH7565502.1 hypothetical protein [Clostridiales bacterium]
MYKFKSLKCYHCNSVLLNLPESEIAKLDGLSFQCECCGHQNILSAFKFHAGNNNAPLLDTISIESLMEF